LTAPRILQVGYGTFGVQHARAWAALEHEALLTIADSSATARDAAAKAHPQARIIADWREALGDCDALDIVAPSDLHHQIAMSALDAGRDLFIEKPMATTAAHAREIAERATATQRIVQVGYLLRIHPAARALREHVRASGVGAMSMIVAEFISLKKPRRDAGVVLNDAVHVLDLMCWILGRLPDEVSATLVERLGRGFEDIAAITLNWSDGPVARVDASCIVPGEHADPFARGAFSRKRLTISGDRGQASVDFMLDALSIRKCLLMPQDDGSWMPLYEEPQRRGFMPLSPIQGMAAQFAIFLDAIGRRVQPEANAQSGVAMAVLADAIFESARRKATVIISGPTGTR
jgi:predicted dehydrogenase